MSLSSEPAFSFLKSNFICGVRDITGETYSGVSGFHDPNGNAVVTSNGAGPHNVQLFALSADGVVLTCLPGYWGPDDLVRELKLAQRLNRVWLDGSLSRGQKEELFRQMQLAHIRQHPPAMVARSHMQGFDAAYEAKYRLNDTDTIRDPSLIADPNSGMQPPAAFKTIDELMHERMSRQPFVPFYSFNIASFVDYGRPRYDKEEDSHLPTGHLARMPDPHKAGRRPPVARHIDPATYVHYYGQ